MSIEKQREFITRQLKRSASDAGVDLDRSLGGLLYIADYQECGDETDFGDDTEEYRKEAAQLWEAHGSSREGRDMLRALGLACLIAYIPMHLTRDWEDWKCESDLIEDGWDGSEERSFVDYALQVGFASSRCADYVARKSGAAKSSWFASIGAKGAQVRHAQMRELRRWTVERYRQQKYPSALAASHELRDEVLEHGKRLGGTPLSKYNAQRTIYGWLLEADKELPAGG
jgi:hypothetical protein